MKLSMVLKAGPILLGAGQLGGLLGLGVSRTRRDPASVPALFLPVREAASVSAVPGMSERRGRGE